MKKYEYLRPGDVVQVSADGVVWEDAVFESWVKHMGVAWVTRKGERESYARAYIRIAPETEAKYTKIPNPPFKLVIHPVNESPSDMEEFEPD